MDVWGSRRFRLRGAAALAGVVVLAAVMGSCLVHGGSANDPESLVHRFTDRLDHRDATGAAGLTSYPGGAEATMKQMFSGLDTGKPTYRVAQYIKLDANSAMFTLESNWNFGPGRDWTYDLQGAIRKLAIGWRISWDPGVVMPALANQHTVRLVHTEAAPAPKVNDNAGEPLMIEEPIDLIRLDPTKMPDPPASTNALAEVIKPVAPLITGPSLLQDLAAAKGQSIVAVKLREDDFAILQPRMANIPGVVMDKQPQLVSADRRIYSPMLDALRKVWQDNCNQHSGWGVQLFDADGHFVSQLAGQQGPPGPDIASTLDPKLQRAAEDAVVSVGTTAAIVAIQPSTGAVVAAAQNNQASEQGSVAFTSVYPSGGAADVFKAAAAAQKKKAPADVSAQEAAEAAENLGIGVGFHVPGLDATTGRLPISGRGVEQVRQGGPDTIQASTFGLAVAAATIARGSVAPPMIEIGRPGTTEAQLAAPPTDVSERLRGLLRDAAANDRELAGLSHYAGVAAYQATAGSSGWLMATMGDLAFAVHIDDVDSGNATARMAARLLQSLAAPDSK